MNFVKERASRLYKNSLGGRIMVRLSLIKTDCESTLNILSDKLADRYFSLAERFVESRKDNYTYFLDVACDMVEEGKIVKIKRSSALKCGASVLKDYTVYDVFEKEAKRIKK